MVERGGDERVVLGSDLVVEQLVLTTHTHAHVKRVQREQMAPVTVHRCQFQSRAHQKTVLVRRVVRQVVDHLVSSHSPYSGLCALGRWYVPFLRIASLVLTPPFVPNLV